MLKRRYCWQAGLIHAGWLAGCLPEVLRLLINPAAAAPLPQVIREGRPCHLYFDLECPVAHNPGLDMDGMVNCLLHHVDEALG